MKKIYSLEDEGGIDWETIEEHADIMDRASKAVQADEIAGIIIEDSSLSILDALNHEMIAKVFWSIHHFTKGAQYNYYRDFEKVVDRKTGILTEDAETSIKESENTKIKLEYLRKEIAKVIVVKNICMGDYADFVKRIAE